MACIDGFVLGVPTADKQTFVDHATRANAVFMEHGAIRIRDGWMIHGGFAPVVALGTP